MQKTIAKSTIMLWVISIVAVLSFLLVLTPSVVEAQIPDCPADTNPIDCGINDAEPVGGGTDLLTVVKNVINTLLYVIGIIAVVMLIVGGIRYVTSAGNQTAVEGARNTILYAIVGIVVAFVAWGAVNFVITALQNNNGG